MGNAETSPAATGFQRVSVSGELWAQIIFRVQESDDDRLRQLVEQAVADAKLEPKP